MNRRQLPCLVFCIAILFAGSQASAQFVAGGGVTKFSAVLPPTNSEYRTVDPFFATYHGSSVTVTLSNTNLAMNPTTSQPGSDELDTFFASIYGQMSINGSPNQHHDATGSGTLLVQGRTTLAGTFNSEILSFNVSGGSYLLRESPTLASTGKFRVTNLFLNGSVYHIDSFFDVFTELSLEGGNSWIPSDTSTHVNLFPEPTSATLLGLGLAAIFGSVRRRPCDGALSLLLSRHFLDWRNR